MTEYQRKKIDLELRAFTSRNFERPVDCKDLTQIRFYVKELAQKIEELENRFNYAPGWAYTLLAQYNAAQNQFLLVEFRKTYC